MQNGAPQKYRARGQMALFSTGLSSEQVKRMQTMEHAKRLQTIVKRFQTIDPIKITVKQLIISIEASLIVLPVNTVA